MYTKRGFDVKIRILHKLKSSSLLLYWLLLVQALSAVFSGIVMIVVNCVIYGGIRLVNYSSLQEWIADGVLICLFWLGMGVVASRDVRPGPTVTVVVLMVWAVLTFLMSNIAHLILVAQQTLGGMLEEILYSLGCGFWNSYRVTIIAYFLLPTAFGVGLHCGWKRTKAADHDKQSG